MTRAGTRPEGEPRTAILVGLAVSFVVAIDAIRLIRADLLVDQEPSFAASRLLLIIVLLTGTVALGGLAAAGFLLWSRAPASREPLRPLGLSGSTLFGLSAAAVIVGGFLRLVALDRRPPVLFIDELCVVPPALALRGSWKDFYDCIRFLPGTPRSFIGVIYLEGYRLLLNLWGTTVFGVRFHSALTGTLSIVTAAFLGRALLPRGGGALAGVVMAGLRWPLLAAHVGWNAVALAPIADLATLLLLRARRSARWPAALAAGVVAGLGSHVYLGAWIVMVALIGFLLWPTPTLDVARRIRLALTFVAGFLLVAAPIFLLRQNRVVPYFARASQQNLLLDIQRKKSWMPPVAVLADALQAPWLLSDPVARHDLPKSRLGWLVGVPLAVAFMYALRHPREELSALLFAHSGAACAASLYWGEPGHPNGVRFAYLATVAAVGAAAGALFLVGLAPTVWRRSASLLAVGCFAVAGFLGARDAVLVWPDSPRTWEAFHGAETLTARTALRWERYGPVAVESPLGESLNYRMVHDYRLDPEWDRHETTCRGEPGGEPRGRGRRFRIVPSGAPLRKSERLVERVRDGAGRDLAAVLGRAACARP